MAIATNTDSPRLVAACNDLLHEEAKRCGF